MNFIDKQSVATCDVQNEWCVFEYLYRDASNYKAWGEVLLSGVPSEDDIAAILSRLESEEYFVAEQVGIPPLYKELWELSGGPTEDDHSMHEFVALRVASENERKSLPLFGEFSGLLKTFQSVTKWDYALSPNFKTNFWP